MQGNGAKEISKRLHILKKSNDGFYIAGEDLKLRGPGDLFGIRQSGLLEFKLGDIYQDADILSKRLQFFGDLTDPDTVRFAPVEPLPLFRECLYPLFQRCAVGE